MVEGLLELNLLRYITVRAALAALTAFALGLVLGPPVIRWLRAHRIGERPEKGDSARLDALHRHKRDTPTMGGVLIIGTAAVAIVLFARLEAFFPLLVLGAMLALGLIGAADDWKKLRSRGRGLGARTKLALQCAVGLAIGLALFAHYEHRDFALQAAERPAPSPTARAVAAELAAAPSLPSPAAAPSAAPPPAPPRLEGTALTVPLLKDVCVPLGFGFVFFAALVLVASCNAVNLTDGLDGLAAGAALPVLAVYTVIAYLVGHAELAAYLWLPHVPGAGEAAVAGAALLGATLAFLWYNAHPAQLFMGDTGSLALGGAIAVLALAVKQELLLVLAGGLFVLEALSVLLQVASFRLCGRRLFRIAPLHHHFQFGGQFETKVTVRFWIVGAMLAVAALITLKVR
ncbi:MAG: phospho-N-acetylmuramoyl-pentapeptide-transferase [Planctomycetota bacterium]|nr:MAG: phospho-N-acetylmuramoyl-pentapeptide-transferase [Planctomycetota bacterium]